MRRVGVDVGGTFTDLVVIANGELWGSKVPTTADQSVGVVEATAGLDSDAFLHGTTTATNTLLEGRGARVALVTDPGFEDLIEIARQDRPSLYDLSMDRPDPLVARELRVSDAEAIGDVDIVAVALLNSYQDGAPEQAVARRISLPCVLSSVVSPEFREYERTATTVLSAYLTPSVAGYLSALDRRLDVTTKLVMTSSGGLIPFDEAPTAAGRLVLSGPAGGVVAAAALGRHHGHQTVISFDMGGTSTDVCRISDGAPMVSPGHRIGERVNRVPSIPVRTIGAGGGSIGWVDPGGALRVGPRSAGADPGPAGYGLGGTEATVTDANIVLGNIPGDLAMGGALRLDVSSAMAAITRLGERVGLDTTATAEGMIEIVDSHMEHALRAVSVEEGADPRSSVLVAFGGAGGLHATRLARRLGIGKVLIPPLSGVFSALGLLLAAPRTDVVKTVGLREGDASLTSWVSQLVDSARSSYRRVFGGEPPTRTDPGYECRYVGQSHELEVVADLTWAAIREAFESAHQQRFGFSRPGEPIELVNIRAVAIGEPPLTWGDLPGMDSDLTPRSEDGSWWRDTLPAGFDVAGPGVIVEANSAVLLVEGDHMTVLEDGTLEVTW